MLLLKFCGIFQNFVVQHGVSHNYPNEGLWFYSVVDSLAKLVH